MSRRTSSTPKLAVKGTVGAGQSVRVLVVDSDTQTGKQLSKCKLSFPVQWVFAESVAEAQQYIQKDRVDLAIIEESLPDGSGLSLVQQLQTGRVRTHAVVLTAEPTLNGALDSIREGAIDVIAKPIDVGEVSQRITHAVGRVRLDRQQHRRIQRLRKICKKLNLARDEVAQQVDILCSDLVSAYQELAQQVHQLTHTSEFTGLIRQELDLESLLRRTLEYLLQKAGPTNAAIFLPATTDEDEYSLGGYVNYECSSESAEILLQHLADVLAPKMVNCKWPMHITDNQTLMGWLGEELTYLEDSHVLAFPCEEEDEILAVVVLFRHQNQPFDNTLVQNCTSIAPILAHSLAKVVRIHHRLGSESDGGDFSFG